MYIDKVRLTNIRGFRDLDFSFDRGNGTHAGWTVLTGTPSPIADPAWRSM